MEISLSFRRKPVSCKCLGLREEEDVLFCWELTNPHPGTFESAIDFFFVLGCVIVPGNRVILEMASVSSCKGDVSLVSGSISRRKYLTSSLHIVVEQVQMIYFSLGGDVFYFHSCGINPV